MRSLDRWEMNMRIFNRREADDSVRKGQNQLLRLFVSFIRSKYLQNGTPTPRARLYLICNPIISNTWEDTNLGKSAGTFYFGLP